MNFIWPPSFPRLHLQSALQNHLPLRLCVLSNRFFTMINIAFVVSMVLFYVCSMVSPTHSASILSRQFSRCPGRCWGSRTYTINFCIVRSEFCSVQECVKEGRKRVGYMCAQRIGSSPPTGSSPTTRPPRTRRTTKSSTISSTRTATSVTNPTPPTTPPGPSRFKSVVMCKSGRSVFNVGIVDVEDNLHIAMFSVTEEKAMADITCIRNDLASVSVEEYLDYAFNNCIGEDQDKCSINNAGVCTCSSMPARCISPAYKRAVNRCEDIES